MIHSTCFGICWPSISPAGCLECLSRVFSVGPLAICHSRASGHSSRESVWLQVRQSRPDYVLLWGWGVMNSTAIKEAQATGYPREKMYGVWWSGAEPDVKDVGEGAKGYNAITMQHGAEPQSAVVKEILEKVHAKGQGTGPCPAGARNTRAL